MRNLSDYLLFNRLIGHKYLQYIFLFGGGLCLLDFFLAGFGFYHFFFHPGNWVFNIMLLAGSFIILRFLVEKYIVFFMFFKNLKFIVANVVGISEVELLEKIDIYSVFDEKNTKKTDRVVGFLKFDNLCFSYAMIFLFFLFFAYFLATFIFLSMGGSLSTHSFYWPFGFFVLHGIPVFASALIAFVLQVVNLRVCFELLFIASVYKLKLYQIWRDHIIIKNISKPRIV